MPSMVAIEEAPIPAAADILDLGQVFSYSGKRTISLKNKATSDLLWPFLLLFIWPLINRREVLFCYPSLRTNTEQTRLINLCDDMTDTDVVTWGSRRATRFLIEKRDDWTTLIDVDDDVSFRLKEDFCFLILITSQKKNHFDLIFFRFDYFRSKKLINSIPLILKLNWPKIRRVASVCSVATAARLHLVFRMSQEELTHTLSLFLSLSLSHCLSHSLSLTGILARLSRRRELCCSIKQQGEEWAWSEIGATYNATKMTRGTFIHSLLSERKKRCIYGWAHRHTRTRTRTRMHWRTRTLSFSLSLSL